MKRVREVIVVEGRYDKSKVSQAVDAAIIETSGFRIFSDKEKVALLRKLAEKRGLIILTDSDKAGFFIRGRLRGMIDRALVKHAYIPDVGGCERRKTSPSKDGRLGVEGMTPDVIIKALVRAGATFEDECANPAGTDRITKSDLFSLGLAGGADSAKKRRNLQKLLDLPERLSANSLLDVLNMLYEREEFLQLL